MLLRYQHDGSLDETFGELGRITLESSILPNNMPRLEIIDDKIVKTVTEGKIQLQKEKEGL